MNFRYFYDRAIWALAIGLVVFISMWISLTWYGMLPASVGDIKKVVDLSSESKDARLLVIDVLTENTNPTIGLISDLNSKVERIIIRDLTGVSVGGDDYKGVLIFRYDWLKFIFTMFFIYFLAVAVSVVPYLYGKFKSNARPKLFFG